MNTISGLIDALKCCYTSEETLKALKAIADHGLPYDMDWESTQVYYNSLFPFAFLMDNEYQTAWIDEETGKIEMVYITEYGNFIFYSELKNAIADGYYELTEYDIERINDIIFND